MIITTSSYILKIFLPFDFSLLYEIVCDDQINDFCLDFSSAIPFLCIANGMKLTIISLENFQVFQSFQVGTGIVNCLSSTENFFAIGLHNISGNEGGLVLMDISTGDKLVESEQGGNISTMKPYNDTFYYTKDDGKIYRMYMKNMQNLSPLDGSHSSKIVVMEISSERLFSGCEDGTIGVWNLQNPLFNSNICMIKTGNSRISDLNSIGNFLLVAVSEEIKVYSFTSNALNDKFENFNAEKKVFSMFIDEDKLIIGETSGVLAIYQIAKEENDMEIEN